MRLNNEVFANKNKFDKNKAESYMIVGLMNIALQIII